ncbi:MAG: UPF0158 family protein [Pseudomonas sp.]|uniref:UPF0158 family protein n=1 Tax=Pseudomonas sp. TaxID=306 RepID=UPI003D105850
MRTLSLDIDVLATLINNREPVEAVLDLETGSVTVLPPGDQDSEIRQQVELEPERYAEIPCLDTEERVALREAFLFTLDDVAAHPLLSTALAGRKPLRTFDYELDHFPQLQEQWHTFELGKLREFTLNWLYEHGLEPAPNPLPMDTRGIPKDILRRLNKNA